MVYKYKFRPHGDKHLLLANQAMLHQQNGELYLATYSRVLIISAQIIQFNMIHAHLPFM